MVLRDVTREREVERLKSDLMATVSHEPRTPLASVLGDAELPRTRRLDPRGRRPRPHRPGRREPPLQRDRVLAGGGPVGVSASCADGVALIAAAARRGGLSAVRAATRPSATDLIRPSPRTPDVPPRTLAALLASLAVAGCSGEPPRIPARAAEPPLAFPHPPRGHLSARADLLSGPRVMALERTHGRSLELRGDTDSRSRLLLAGCANGRRCAGTDVIHAVTVGCPPPDAEVWSFATLDPNGADLDAAPDHPGAAAWRQAVADLRPRITLVFRTSSTARVRVAGPRVAAARRFARIAGLPFSREPVPQGLAAWATTVRPRTTSIAVELPGERMSARRAVRLAYALDRLAGTRFAAGALSERRLMLRHGRDPRENWH